MIKNYGKNDENMLKKLWKCSIFIQIDSTLGPFTHACLYPNFDSLVTQIKDIQVNDIQKMKYSGDPNTGHSDKGTIRLPDFY